MQVAALLAEQEATILLLLPVVRSKGFIPAKLFEYLGAARPILSIHGQGDVVEQLLNETQAGVAAAEANQIADIVLRSYRQWEQTGSVCYHGLAEQIARYTHRGMAQKFAAVLNEVVDAKAPA